MSAKSATSRVRFGAATADSAVSRRSGAGARDAGHAALRGVVRRRSDPRIGDDRRQHRQRLAGRRRHAAAAGARRRGGTGGAARRQDRAPPDGARSVRDRPRPAPRSSQDEILLAIEGDALAGYGGRFEKVGHRRSLVISTVCLAAVVKVDAPAAASTTCALPSPASVRCRAAGRCGKALRGAPIGADLIETHRAPGRSRPVAHAPGLSPRGRAGLLHARSDQCDQARGRRSVPFSRPNWRQLCLTCRFEATVNGRKVKRYAKPHQRLLDLLRDDLAPDRHQGRLRRRRMRHLLGVR